ncbi:hypothetical protein [uncultured Nostoc sp.]
MQLPILMHLKIILAIAPSNYLFWVIPTAIHAIAILFDLIQMASL